MLRLQRYDGGAELDAGRARAHQRDGQQGVKVVGHLGNPGGVHARVLGPLDVGKHPGDLARGIATLRADHYSEAHGSTVPFRSGSRLLPVSVRISRTSTSSAVPVGNTAAAPAASSLGTSLSGIVPPTTTAISA